MARTRSPERTQFLHDVMITALEGGVGYWSVADDIVRHTNDDLWYSSYVLFCYEGDVDPKTGVKVAGECGADDKEGQCKGHKVTPEVVSKGLGIALDYKKHPEIGLHKSHRAHYFEASIENDGGEIDAGDADNIVQLGIFGKVIFG